MISRIKNGKIISGKKIVCSEYIYFGNGKITAVTDENLSFDDEIDAEGCYVSPGFIDLHVHGGAGYDFMDGTKEAVVGIADFHLTHGTTTVFPTTLAADMKSTKKALECIRDVADKKMTKACIAGVHMEGPYFSLNQSGAQNRKFIMPPKREDYIELLEKYSNIIRRWSFAPELEGTTEFMHTLNEYGVIASVAHTDAVYEDVMRVYDLGCKLITHFYSCMSTVTRKNGFRILGVTETGYLYDDIAIELIADGCHVPKELFKMAYKIKGSDSICLVTDAMRCSGTEEKISHIGGVPCIIEDGVAKLTDRTAFAGSIATADRLVRFCVKDAGIALTEVIKMITETPARVMKLARKGKIEVGYDAEFVIFDDDINVKKVIVQRR